MRPRTITSANSSTPLVPARTENRDQSESLFEQVAWLYAFFREHLFRDDTNRMIAALWPSGRPTSGTELIEFGCGPGFYSRRLAQPFPQISVTGVDRSENQLRWARERASAIRLSNCLFECVNVLQLPCEDARFDALIASNRASSHGSCKTLTHSKRQFESLIAEARSRAQRNWFSERSTPVTEICGNGWASRRE